MGAILSPDSERRVIGSERVRTAFAIEWTRGDCYKLEESGVLTRRYELLEGDIIYQMPQKTGHRVSVSRAFGWLSGIFGADRVQTQAAIDVAPEDNPTSEPEPDVVLLQAPRTVQDADNPRPQEIALCIEVGDATLSYDLSTKAGLYARAGIVEYWVISIPERSVHVHRDPQNGVYRIHDTFGESDTVALLVSPHTMIPVADLLASPA